MKIMNVQIPLNVSLPQLKTEMSELFLILNYCCVVAEENRYDFKQGAWRPCLIHFSPHTVPCRALFRVNEAALTALCAFSFIILLQQTTNNNNNNNNKLVH
jgi:hypothetical protein